MMSNNNCPECGYNGESNNHVIPVMQVFNHGELESYQYDCPECGYIWTEDV